jgi:hypothetical protein
MLVTPFPADSSSIIRRLQEGARPGRGVRRPVGFLLAWVLAGLATLALVPFARGDRMLGATLPFWLIAAPLLDLAWIERRRLARYSALRVKDAVRRRRATARGAIRLRR